VVQGRFERLYGLVYFKVTGKVLEEEEQEEEQEQEKDEEDHDDAQDDPGSKKPVKQELAMLDWMPWDTRVEPVAARYTKLNHANTHKNLSAFDILVISHLF
jgi:hypothetical protein